MLAGVHQTHSDGISAKIAYMKGVCGWSTKTKNSSFAQLLEEDNFVLINRLNLQQLVIEMFRTKN